MTRVWYAAYGSNLSRARFDIYLRGGTPAGATHAYPGCRDPSPPSRVLSWRCDRTLRFGGRSVTWGGGVALLDAARAGVAAKLRLYLVTVEQFADVVAQENWLPPGSIDLAGVALEAAYTIGDDHTYRVVLPLGSHEDHQVVTVTQDAASPTNAPTIRYLSHIARGLRESHGCSDAEIAGYLAACPGVAGVFGRDELASVLAIA